jgi:hypothetical protein
MDRVFPAEMSPIESDLVELAERELGLERRIRARQWFVRAALLATGASYLYARAQLEPLLVGPVVLVGFAIAALWSALAEHRARKEHARALARIPEEVRMHLALS